MLIELRVCLVQVKGRTTKEQLLANVNAFVREAVGEYNPRVVALPECFNGPYEEEKFHEFAEVIPSGPSSQLLSSLAQELNIYLLGGIIERDANDTKLMYNSCVVFGPDGSLIARHRKTHLCDFEGVREIKEVNYLQPGNGITTFDVDGIKCGVAICFDAAFSSFIHLYKQAGKCVMDFNWSSECVVDERVFFVLHQTARSCSFPPIIMWTLAMKCSTWFTVPAHSTIKYLWWPFLQHATTRIRMCRGDILLLPIHLEKL